MDCSTHIDDLPIIEEDQPIIEEKQEPIQKRVQFNEQPQYNERQFNKPISKTWKECENIYMILFLCFILLNEPKVKKYLFEVLNVIIGSIVYNPSGSISKTGSFLYSIIFVGIVYILNEYIIN